eukprot:TRINITY_DN25978_c0_g1_i1.p1 TRINITY_DN25978_c0_g1~~TRINITY_DN25978_c0_g1_i1.p1  ORF type:complete len:141 (+),score=40.97 TRINITY_DN25978_c0_g1_i1:68-490(+)
MPPANDAATATEEFTRQLSDLQLERRQLDARLTEVRSANEAQAKLRAGLLATKARQEGDLALLGELLATHTAAQATSPPLPAARAHQERLVAQEGLLYDSLGRKVAEEAARAAAVRTETAALVSWQPLPNAQSGGGPHAA